MDGEKRIKNENEKEGKAKKEEKEDEPFILLISP